MSTSETPIDRPTARVLLLDDEHHVLLFRTRDLGGPTQRPFWLAPGGGLQPGESYDAAARRELREETGLDRAIGPCVWQRQHTWFLAHDGVWYRSLERYFVVRTARVEIARTGRTALERRTIAESRWWSVAAIAASDELFVPRRLATWLTPILAGELPVEPIDVGV